jgi:2-keto-3-deoxy-L-fuconate dehydrogenase
MIGGEREVGTMEFDGMAAVVTGGASGIGAATARTLLERGAHVAVLDLRTEGAPEGALAVACDVTDAAQVEAAIAHAVARLGGLDVLVNNAGIGAAGSVEANDDEEWHRVLDVNVLGVVRATRAALPHLRRSHVAAIVNTSSAVAAIGLPQRALYTASKGAVQALTLAMAADALADGIRVNCVMPGTVDTEWVGRLLDAEEDTDVARRRLEARQPLGRLGNAEEIAAAIAYLASPASAFTTATALGVDGGILGMRVAR